MRRLNDGSRAFVALRAAGCLLAVCGGLLLPDAAWAQLGFRNRAEQALDQILLAPRPLTRLLREGKQAIDEKRYSDGIAVLGALLLQEERDDLPEDALRQDFFTEASGNGYYKNSVRSEALRLLGSIPEEGRKTLEIQYGVAARQQLDAAVAARDLAAISEIARKYYHTDAGYDASILLAQDKLIRGYPIAAASILQRLNEFPAARKRFGAQLVGEVASAWVQAGRSDLAVAALEQGLKQFTGATVQLGSQPVRLDASQDWNDLLARIFPAQSQADQRPLKNWLMTGGEPDRNGSIAAGLPLPSLNWDMTLHRNRNDEESVAAVAARESQAGSVLLPKLEARMVGDIVLAKTATSSVFAIDLETGLRLWPFYKHLAPVELAPRGTGLPADVEEAVASRDLMNRIWGSSAFGQFTCDSNQLYYISGADDRQFDQTVFNPLAPGSSQASHNFLTGVSLQGEGKVMWHVGGADGQNEPQLAGAYFLGPPLSFEGELYTLVEINLETRLVVLDARTGKLQWSQQLMMSPLSPIGKDPTRQALALSPSISDAVVVCPAGNGAIIAVDLLSRSLLWARQYPTLNNDQHQFQAFNNFADSMDNYDPSEERWQESQVLIHKGQIVYTPPETNILMCLDLLTGDPRWQQTRGAARYIAGVVDDRIIVVANTEVFALDLADGRPSWPADVPLSSRLPANASSGAEGKPRRAASSRDRETVAGKSVRDGHFLYVPTSAQRVLKIDVAKGQLVDAVTVEQPLGNLFSFKDRMLSVGPTRITCYYSRKALSEEVQQRLAGNPNDTWALNQQALIYLADDRTKEAIDLLRRSFAIRSDDGETRYLLVRALLTGLEEDFDSYIDLATELEPIIESQHFHFLVLLVKGNLRSGENELAFSRLLELMRERLLTRQPSSQARVEMMTLAPGHEVDIDMWIAAQLARAYGNGTPEQRQRMLQLIQQRLAAAGKSHPLTRQMELQYLAWLEPAQAALLALGESLLGDIDQSLGERLLQPVLSSPDAELRKKALAALARTMHTKEASAENFLDADQIRIIGGRQSIQVGPSTDVAPEPIEWPRGMVEGRVSREGGLVSYGQNRLKQTGTRYGRPPVEISLSSEHLAILNQLGEVLSVCEFERGNFDGIDPFLRCQVDGGLIFLETQSELAAFDMYRARESAQDACLWRYSLARASGGARTPAGTSTVQRQISALGIPSTIRGVSGREALVGPVTPVGVVIQKGSDLIMLSPLTGNKVWSRGGYDERSTIGRDGLEIAVINPAMAKIDILDCRDGTLLRQVEHADDWSSWFTCGQIAVQTTSRPTKARSGGGIQVEADNSSALRLLNMFTGEVVLKREFEPGSRADSCDDRYLAVLEPSGKLWYCDAQTNMVAEHAVPAQVKVDRVWLQRFDNRMVLLTHSPQPAPPVTVLPKAEDPAISRGLYPVNGLLVGLDRESGSLLWDRPAKLLHFTFPNSQPRLSPYMVCYRVLRSGGNPIGSAVPASVAGIAQLVAIDLRDGTLAYSDMALNLSNQDTYEFAMKINSVRPIVSISIGLYTTTLVATELDKPPQPVCVFGTISPPQAARPRPPFSFFNPSP